MDWGKLLGGLGNAGDILSGKESYNSIKRGNMADTTANRQITSQDTQAAERNNLQKLMQKIQIAADALSQDKGIGANKDLQIGAQGFTRGENAADRDLRLRMQGIGIASDKEIAESNNKYALGRTMAPLEFEQKRLNDLGINQPIPVGVLESNPAFQGVPPGITWAQMPMLGQAGQAAGNFSNPYMMHGGGYSSYLANQGVAELMDRFLPDDKKRTIAPGVGQVGPGGVPMRGPAAPRTSPFTPGK